MRKLCLLGSTGSIGTQTLDIIRLHGDFEVYAIAARSSIGLLEKQIREFKPRLVCVYDEKAAAELAVKTSDLNVDILTGMEGLITLVQDPKVDLVVTALVGMIGIRPTIAAIEAGKDVALANKETLVTAGHIIMPMLGKHKVRLLPIDSEHSAILQCLQGKYGPAGYYDEKGRPVFGSAEVKPAADDLCSPANRAGIDKILLTASGGPFRGLSYNELSGKTAQDALKHPNWSMGRKITIDSASMVNKALEVMEARWLFDVNPDNIKVVIQPKSIIHSAVEFVDGSILAQLGCPDMRLPIQYALYDRERLFSPTAKLDLFEIGHIDFEKPDYETFRGLRLGLDAIRLGGSICTVFNAANEFAVAEFLEGRISFTGIYDIIEAAMQRHNNIKSPDLEEILEAERETRSFAESLINV